MQPRALKGHTPLTFADGHTVDRAELNNVRWVSHAGTWSSSQWRPDDEFETDRRHRSESHKGRKGDLLSNEKPKGTTGRVVEAGVAGPPELKRAKP
jgi:hypothetical protein